MQFRPGFDESVLASWEGTTDQLNGVNTINAYSLLVVGVKMRPVMWRTGFGIHANNNPKKAGEFWHDLIIPQGCGVVVSPCCEASTVGMPVTRHPPYSPGRAVFPHPVLRLYSLPRCKAEPSGKHSPTWNLRNTRTRYLDAVEDAG